MRPEIVSYPEEGRVYLVRGRIGGRVNSRFKPARVTSVYAVDGVSRIRVQFLYDSETEVTDLVMYDGLVREITRAHLDAERAILNRNLQETLAQIQAVDDLLASTGIR